MRTLGWVTVAVSVVILLVFRVFRLADLAKEPPPIASHGPSPMARGVA